MCSSSESLNFAVVEARNFLSRLKPRKAAVFEGYRAAAHMANGLLKAEGKLQFHIYGRTKFYSIIDSFPTFDVMVARDGYEAALKHFEPNTGSYDGPCSAIRPEGRSTVTDVYSPRTPSKREMGGH